jgi:hypothetical protein
MGSFTRKVAGDKSTRSMARILGRQKTLKIMRKTLGKGLANCSPFRLYKQQRLEYLVDTERLTAGMDSLMNQTVS